MLNLREENLGVSRKEMKLYFDLERNYFTTREIGQLVGRSERSVRRWIVDGMLDKNGNTRYLKSKPRDNRHWVKLRDLMRFCDKVDYDFDSVQYFTTVTNNDTSSEWSHNFTF